MLLERIVIYAIPLPVAFAAFVIFLGEICLIRLLMVGIVIIPIKGKAR